MNVSESLQTVFSAEIETRNGTPIVTVPDREIELGGLAVGERYQVAIIDATRPSDSNERSMPRRTRPTGPSTPPVETGEIIDVEIESVGEQGDGVARVGEGYVVFVPDTAVGDRVSIEITEARENFGFAEVVEEEPISG